MTDQVSTRPRANTAPPENDSPDVGSYETVEHELRTPLAVIRAATEIIRDYPNLDEAERDQLLSAVADELQRLDLTVDRLLEPWQESSLPPCPPAVPKRR